LGLQIDNKNIMVKVVLVGITKHGARITNLKTTNPNYMKRRVMGSQRTTLESSVRSTKTIGTTLDPDECHSKQSLLSKLKDIESYIDSNFDSKLDMGKQIINMELEEPKEGEHLFHSHM